MSFIVELYCLKLLILYPIRFNDIIILLPSQKVETIDQVIDRLLLSIKTDEVDK